MAGLVSPMRFPIKCPKDGRRQHTVTFYDIGYSTSPMLLLSMKVTLLFCALPKRWGPTGSLWTHCLYKETNPNWWQRLSRWGYRSGEEQEGVYDMHSKWRTRFSKHQNAVLTGPEQNHHLSGSCRETLVIIGEPALSFYRNKSSAPQ